MKKEKRERHTWYLVRYMQALNRLSKSEVRASVLRVKTPCERGQPHYAYVLQAEQKATRSFPMERGDPLRSTILRGIRSARSALRRGVSVPLPLGPFLTKKKSPVNPVQLSYETFFELLLQQERGLNRNTTCT